MNIRMFEVNSKSAEFFREGKAIALSLVFVFVSSATLFVQPVRAEQQSVNQASNKSKGKRSLSATGVSAAHTKTKGETSAGNTLGGQIAPVRRTSDVSVGGKKIGNLDASSQLREDALGGSARADAAKKSVDRMSDVRHQGGEVQQGIGQGPSGVGQRGVADRLGIGDGPGQQMGKIESGIPKVSGSSGGVSHSPGAVVIDELSSEVSTGEQKDTSDKSNKSVDSTTGDKGARSTGAGSTSGGGKAGSSRGHSVWFDTLEAEVAVPNGGNTKAGCENEGDDRGAAARAKVKAAVDAQKSVSHHIAHGSGEKPGVTGAPTVRAPVKKGGKAPIVKRDGTDGNSGVKLNIPKGSSPAYDPAKEGIGADVQPK